MYYYFIIVTQHVLNIHRSGCTALFGCYMAGATRNCCHRGTHSVYTLQPCTILQCYFIRSNIGCTCLAVTCHLHFWQNDQDHLRATVVTRGWNGHRSEGQQRKLTLEKKILSRRSCRDSNTNRFDHECVAVPLSHPRSRENPERKREM